MNDQLPNELVIITMLGISTVQKFGSEFLGENLVQFVEAYMQTKYDSTDCKTFQEWSEAGYRIKKGTKAVVIWDTLKFSSSIDCPHCDKVLLAAMKAGTTKKVFMSKDVFKPEEK